VEHVYGPTVVFSVSELFWLLGSAGEAAETVALFFSVPFALGLAMIVTVAAAPLPIVPSEHVTVFLDGFDVHVPCEELAELKPAFLGSVSLTVTPVAAAGRLFLTASVYVSVAPFVQRPPGSCPGWYRRGSARSRHPQGRRERRRAPPRR
jgi:hypothetical protein